jgi:group I intron endonuclease
MRGIYSITNIFTNTVYYGQSKNCENRLRVHECSLKGNYHHNPILQSSWNKYGKEAFIFTPILESNEDLTRLEKKYISEAYSIGLKLFNIADPEDPTKLSAESIKRMIKTKSKKHYKTVNPYLNEAIQKMSLYW